MASSVFLCFLSLSSLFVTSLAAASSSTVTLSLSPITHSLSIPNSWEYSTHTLQRAHHLKRTPHRNQSPVLQGSGKTPLFPRSYGGYSVSLSFGTPPQRIPLVFDTGSSLVWVPCTKSYTCENCTFSNTDPSKIRTFKLRRSSTFRMVECRNPKCGLLFGSDAHARCSGLGSGSPACPHYLMQYGLGSTYGRPVSDSLDLPGNVVVPGLFLGCSIYSVQQPEGIAGFGRAPTSLPNQLRLRKFAYCLLSHEFDDKPKTSDLILVGRKSAVRQVHGVMYTPLLKNPDKSPYDEYYYVHLTKITVGKNKTRVKLPSGLLVPDQTGNGGTIVDSGSTYTFMDKALFGPLVKEMEAQIFHYKRAQDAEAQLGFGLCYNIPGVRNVSFPELVLHFKGGAKMELAVANYFTFMTDLKVWCLTIVSDSSPVGPSGPVGPVVILGNDQQQDYYFEYDLQHHRLGFKKQKCG